MSFQNVGDRFFTEVMVEFEQFPLDFTVAQIGILAGEPHDKTFDFPLGARAPACLLLLVSPLAPDQLAMPAKDCFGLNDANHVAQLLERMPRGSFQLRATEAHITD